MRKLKIVIAFLLVLGSVCSASVGKTKVVVWRPDFASYTFDLERVVFIPVLKTSQNLYAAIRLRSAWYNNAFHTPTWFNAATIGKCYSAKIWDEADMTNSGWWRPMPCPFGGGGTARYNTAEHLNEDITPPDTLTVTLDANTYGSNATVRILAWSNTATGIAKLTIDGSSALVNGKDTYLDGSDRKIDFYNANFATGYLIDFEVATGLDTTGVAHSFVITTTNEKNASSSAKQLDIAAIILVNPNSEVDPDVSCWIEGLYREPSWVIRETPEHIAWNVDVNGTAKWVGELYFGTSPNNCIVIDPNTVGKERNGERWFTDYAGTLWTPAAGARAAFPWVRIEQDFVVQHPTVPTDLCNWRVNFLFQPGNFTISTNLDWTTNCTVKGGIIGSGSYSSTILTPDTTKGADYCPLWIEVPNRNAEYIPGNAGLVAYSLYSQYTLYGGVKMFGTEVVVSTAVPVFGVYGLAQTKGLKIYMQLDTANIAVVNGDKWVISSQFLFQGRKAVGSLVK